MLGIGVVTSIFTAVVATRAMLACWPALKFMSSPRVLGQLGTGDRWKRFDFIGRTSCGLRSRVSSWSARSAWRSTA